MGDGGVRLRVLWRVCTVLPLSGVAFAAGAMAVPNNLARLALEALVIAVCLATTLLLWWMREVVDRVEVVADDLSLVAGLDLETIGTGGLNPSKFAEVNILEERLLMLVRVIYECRPYFPDQVVQALESEAILAASGQSQLEMILEDFPQAGHRGSLSSLFLAPLDANSGAVPGVMDVAEDMIELQIGSGPIAPCPSPNPYRTQAPDVSVPWQGAVFSRGTGDDMTQTIEVVMPAVYDGIEAALTEGDISEASMNMSHRLSASGRSGREDLPSPGLLDSAASASLNVHGDATAAVPRLHLPPMHFSLPDHVKQQLQPEQTAGENAAFHRGFLNFAAAKLKAVGQFPPAAACPLPPQVQQQQPQPQQPASTTLAQPQPLEKLTSPALSIEGTDGTLSHPSAFEHPKSPMTPEDAPGAAVPPRSPAKPPLPTGTPPSMSPWLRATASSETASRGGVMRTLSPTTPGSPVPQVVGPPVGAVGEASHSHGDPLGGVPHFQNHVRHVAFRDLPSSETRRPLPANGAGPLSSAPAGAAGLWVPPQSPVSPASPTPSAPCSSFRGRQNLNSSFSTPKGRQPSFRDRGSDAAFHGVPLPGVRARGGQPPGARRRSSLNGDIVELTRRKINLQNAASNPTSPALRMNNLRSNFADAAGQGARGDAASRRHSFADDGSHDVLVQQGSVVSPLVPPSKRAGMTPRYRARSGSLAGVPHPRGTPLAAPRMDAGLASLQLGMRRKKGTLLSITFDIKELATFDLHETFEVASSFVSVVLEIVRAEVGEVCQFGADHVLCSWNTHAPCPRQALSACRAALEIQQAIMAEPDDTPLNPGCSETSSPLIRTPSVRKNVRSFSNVDALPPTQDDGGHWSIAVASGTVFCGNIGTESYRSAFVFGHALDQVHLLNRLSLQLVAPILVADSTKAMLHCPDLLLRPLDVVDWSALGCLETPREPVYELLHASCAVNVERWRQAFHAFLCGEYRAAHDMFKALQGVCSDAQLFRMLRLTSSQYSEALPETYVRGMQFWNAFAGEPVIKRYTGSPVTPALSTPTREKKTKKATALSKAMERHHGKNKEAAYLRQGSTLRTAIEQAQKAAAPNSDSDSDSDMTSSSSSMGGDDAEPPKEFTDSSGARWRRSGRMIGSGAIGDVWLGMSGEGSFVAFKCVKLPKQVIDKRPKGLNLGRRPDASSDIHSIINEVDVLSKYRHESIVSFISCGVYEQFVIITMEYVSGGSLAGVIDHFGSLPQGTVRRYTREILRGLQYLHGKNLIHCDLKPANVLIHTDGCCKLSDFGTSFKLSSVTDRSGPEGTPLFMAPESCRGAPCPASDLWSLGLTVIQMLLDQTPFAWDPELSDLPRLQFSRWLCQEEGDVPLPSPDALGANASAFVNKCMVRNPAGRPQTETLMYDIFVMS